MDAIHLNWSTYCACRAEFNTRYRRDKLIMFFYTLSCYFNKEYNRSVPRQNKKKIFYFLHNYWPTPPQETSIQGAIALGCLPFDGKFRKFQPKIEEYVLRWSFHSGWYEPNGMLLTINRFLLGSRLTLHKFALFLDSNRNGCGVSTVNW